MKYRSIPGLPREVSTVVLGTMRLGELDEGAAYSLLDSAVAHGVTLIDTAREYCGGQSEVYLGRWLKRQDPEQRPMILSKGCHPDPDYRPRLTRQALWDDVRRSLDALHCDSIPLYMFHQDDPNVPVDEAVDWLEEVKAARMIGGFGLSNWSQRRCESAVAYARRDGLGGMVAISNYFGLAQANRSMWPGCVMMGHDDLAWQRRLGLPNFAWACQGAGYFAKPTRVEDGGAPVDDDVATPTFGSPSNLDRARRADELGRRYGMSATQVACAFVVRQSVPQFAVVGPLNDVELHASVAAASLPLTKGEVDWLRLARDTPGSLLGRTVHSGRRMVGRVVASLRRREVEKAEIIDAVELKGVKEPHVGSDVGEEELAAVRRVVKSGVSLSWGEEIAAFEVEFARYVGAAHAVTTSSGTTALEVAAQILRLGPGDEVVCTPQSFWATALALRRRGVVVRFADIDPSTLNIAPTSIPPLVGAKTKAIYLVHYGGVPADLDSVRRIAETHHLVVVEDCAHALGARYRGRMIGSDADLACFSFGSLKNMTTLGEGGMLCTSREDWAAEARELIEWGVVGEMRERTPELGPYRQPSFDDHSFGSWTQEALACDEFGNNYHLSTVEAAVGRVQLRRLPEFLRRRQELYDRYNAGLQGLDGIRLPSAPEESVPAWHVYNVFLEPPSAVRRDGLIAELQRRGIEILLRYFPLHLHRTFRALGHQLGEAPVCERVWFESQIGLPFSSTLSNQEIDYVVDAVRDSVNAEASRFE